MHWSFSFLLLVLLGTRLVLWVTPLAEVAGSPTTYRPLHIVASSLRVA